MLVEKKIYFSVLEIFIIFQNYAPLAVTVENKTFFVNEVSFDESLSSKTIKESKNMRFKLNLFQVKR